MTRKQIIITLFSITAFILILVSLGVFEEELKETDYSEVVQFMEDMKNKEEVEIDVVTYYSDKASLENSVLKQPNGWIIYRLKARYDKVTNQSWIDVTPDLSRFKNVEKISGDLITSHQQCGYINHNTDENKGKVGYMLTECFHKWEYDVKPSGFEGYRINYTILLILGLK